MAAVFLAVPEDVEGGWASEIGERGALPLGAGSLTECAVAPRAPTHGHVRRITPRRYDEVVEEVLILEVVREDGRPISGAEVRAFNQGIDLEAATDADGRARLQAHPDACAFVTVSGSAFMPEVQLMSLDPGVKRFVVPTRFSLMGRVMIRGQLPPRPLSIGLLGHSGVAVLQTQTDSDGRITFFNLPTCWHGQLVFPDGYRREREVIGYQTGTTYFTDGTSASLYSDPHRSFGRYANVVHVDPPGSSGSDANAAPIGTSADIDVGTFLIPSGDISKDRSPFDQPGITIVAAPVRDLGVIDLIPQQKFPIRILDESGNPIAGAMVWNARAMRFCPATDENGRSMLRVDDGSTEQDLRTSLRVWSQKLNPSAWLPIDAETVVLTELSRDSVTLRVTLPSTQTVESPR